MIILLGFVDLSGEESLERRTVQFELHVIRLEQLRLEGDRAGVGQNE